MNGIEQTINKNGVSRFQKYLSEIPFVFFVVLFLLSSGCLLLTKIEASDLWWHLACGRYFFENGEYPPPGTFTFSPVGGPTGNAHTWLGDLVLYCIHKFCGGEAGLQFFRIVVVCIPAWIFIKLTGNLYNTWTLLGSIFIVMGTYQQNLLKNSIFAMIFLPIIVWIWHFSVKERNIKLLLLYPGIFLLWSNMHGYALVGVVVLILFFLGEMMDQFLQRKNKNFYFLLVLLIVVGCSWKIVEMNWSVNPLKKWRNIEITSVAKNLSQIFSEDQIAEHLPEEGKPPINENTQKNFEGAFHKRFSAILNQIKLLFRCLIRGGDAEIVFEYKSPFDVYGILPAKAIFILSMLYMAYLLSALIYDPKGLRLSYILPSLATLFIGFGYIRTIAFPFLVCVPLMAAHLPVILKQITENQTRIAGLIKKILPWLGIAVYFVMVFYILGTSHIFSTFFSIVIAGIIAWIYLVCFRMPQMPFRLYDFLFWALPLILSVQVGCAGYYFWKEKNFSRLTGISIREPGIGRNSMFRDVLPAHILKEYRNENVLNSHSIGGFLIWKWFDEKKVFIDSRSIAYTPDFYKNYAENFAFGYLNRLDIDKALLDISLDENFYHAYSSHNWALLSFDISAILLKKGTGKGYKSSYGIIPEFRGELEDLNCLSAFKLWNFGSFINNTIRYMLLFGRLSDAIQWIESIQAIIKKLPLTLQQNIDQKREFMKLLEGHFGRINDPLLASLCQDIDKTYTPVSLNMALGDAYLGFNRKKEAARMYMTAAKSDPKDINLQRKVGNLMFEMGFIDPAIYCFKIVIGLNPDLVDEYIKLGYFYAMKKEYDQSEKFLRKLLVKAPQHPQTYINLGIVLTAKADIKAALDIYKKGLSILPENKQLKQALNSLEQKQRM